VVDYIMKSLFDGNTKQHKAVLILGSILIYGGLNWGASSLTLPSAPVVVLRPQIAVPVVMGLAFGPLAGFMAGFFGNALGDLLIGYQLTFWNWHIANGIIGLIPGLAYLFGIRVIRTIREFGIIQLFTIAGIFLGMSFAFLSEWSIFQRLDMEEAAMNWYLPGIITNLLFALVLVPPLMIFLRRMVLTLEIRIILIITYLLIASVLMTTTVLTYVANSLLLSYANIQAGFQEMIITPSGSQFAEIIAGETTLTLLRWAGFVSVFILIAGSLFAVLLARRVTAPLALLSNAAQNVERGDYASVTLEPVIHKNDELGQLARIFQEMMDKVQSREQDLRQKIQTLQIEIDREKEAKQVSEITETEFFQNLQQKAKELRERRSKL
jgi:HAMP domain-containing protein